MITGYTDRFSVRAGEKIEVKVSSDSDSDYFADLVRIFSADPNPAGPGVDLRPVASSFEGYYKSTLKQSCLGSYGSVFLNNLCDQRDFVFSIRFQPRLLSYESQALFSFIHRQQAMLAIGVDKGGLSLEIQGAIYQVPCELVIGHWLELRLSCTDKGIGLTCYSVKDGNKLCQIVVDDKVQGELLEMLLLAANFGDSGAITSFFNGRLEAPALSSCNSMEEGLLIAAVSELDVLAQWDLSKEINSDVIVDVGPHGMHGKLHNMPTRAVRGSRWSGSEMCWKHAPEEYAAVHFHEGDLYDCGWDTDFSFDVPLGLPSGVYGFRLVCDGAEDIIPFFVRPSNTATSKIAVLFSTLTYLAYSNYPRTNFDSDYVAQRDAWNTTAHHPAEYPEFGRSLYDCHRDGSGVMYSSGLRPQLLMRPGFFAYLDKEGSGLRHFPADMHLIAWFEAKGIEVDIVTDHDLDTEGSKALEDYDLVLTVTHPEYHTDRTLDAIEGFINSGGSFGYLGGNGFYWRVATSESFPNAIELRRAESGVRMWEAETGEFFNSFDGQYGGLWLKNDRPPQKVFGIGMTAQGCFNASYYRRTEASFAPSHSWIFDGIDDEIIGDFGFSGGGAAGFELDCTDSSLGTPIGTVVLACSENHSSDYECVPEKVWNPDLHTPEWRKQQIKAEMVYLPKDKGNFVFSTGSIMFCGSLPFNGYNNNTSRLLENIVRSCL